MEQLYNLLLYFFALIGSLSGLLLGVTFTRGQRKKYPLLKNLDSKQLILAIVTALSLVLSQLSGYLRDEAGLRFGIQTLKELGAYEYAVDNLLRKLGRESTSAKNRIEVLDSVISEYMQLEQNLAKIKHIEDKNKDRAREALQSLEFETASGFVVASTFSEAKKLLDTQVFKAEENRRTFYCGCNFTSNRTVLPDNCEYKANTSKTRVSWDHIVPISWIAVGRQCLVEGCNTKTGESYGGRKCCEEIDPFFNQAQNDLHNIWPSIDRINLIKSNYEVNYVGESGKDVGCGFLVERKGKRFQPPNAVKGDVARVVLYMTDTYKIPLSFHQNRMLQNWHQDDPVNEWESKRNRIIYDLQGNSNSYIEKLPNKTIQLTAESGN